MILNDIPDDVVVNAEVVMDDDVTEPDELSPFDLRMSRTLVRRELSGRLADDGELANECVKRHPVALELLSRQVFSVLKHEIAGFDNVIEQKADPMRHVAGLVR